MTKLDSRVPESDYDEYSAWAACSNMLHYHCYNSNSIFSMSDNRNNPRVIITHLTPELNSWCNLQNPRFKLQDLIFFMQTLKKNKKQQKRKEPNRAAQE
jgi:hypothetical protein